MLIGETDFFRGVRRRRKELHKKVVAFCFAAELSTVVGAHIDATFGAEVEERNKDERRSGI